jgi:hypothetical protein
VHFRGEVHDLDGVGIRPMPVQRPIPVWMGTGPTRPALRRIARSGDGWICRYRPTEDVAVKFARIRQEAESLGRDPAGIGLQGMIQWNERKGLDEHIREVEAWLGCGANRVSFSGARAGRSPEEHLDYVAGLAEVLARFR